MMKGILFDTYVEMRSRKIGIIFGVVTILTAMFGFGMSSADISVTFNGQNSSNPLAVWGMTFLDYYFTALGAFAIFAVAGLFPSMMQKGRAEFYLSKPISRHTIFFYRFISIFVVYGSLIVISGLASYAVFAFSTGVNGLSFLWVAGFQLLIFFSWLAIVTLAGVLFNSGSIAIMAAFFLWVTQYILQLLQGPPTWIYKLLKSFLESDMIYYLRTAIYYIIPKTTQAADIGVSLAAGNPVESLMPIWSTALFTLGAFWLALILFRRKDY